MRQLISIYQHGYVKDDTFVPVKKVAKDNSDLKEKLLQISGIQINDVDGRVYTLGQRSGTFNWVCSKHKCRRITKISR